MKILLVTKQLLDVREGAVYSQFALSSTLALFRCLGDLYVCACATDRESTQPVDTLTCVDPEKVAFIDNENSLSKRFFNRSHNRQAIQRFVGLVDLVVGYEPASVADLAFSVARRMGKKYMTFLVACVWDGMWCHRSWKAKAMAPLAFLQTRHTVRNSHYVWYVTERFLQHRYPTRGKSLGCTDTNIPEECGDVLDMRIRRIQRLATRRQPLRLLTVGHLDVGFKGQRFVIEALALLRKRGIEAEYVMVGAGKGDYLGKLAEQKGVADCVVFAGKKTRSEVLQYMDQADIYLQPSLQEGLPRSIAEAMSRAMPVIGSRTGGIPEMLDPLFVTRRRNVDDIVAAVCRLDAEEMVRQARRNFQMARNYMPSVVNKRVGEFFDMIIAENQPACNTVNS